MTEPRRRGRPPKKQEEPMEAPPLTIDDPAFLAEVDAEEDNEAAMAEVDALLEQERLSALEAEQPKEDVWKPKRSSFLDLDNGLYLPVRQRVIWMRGGEPVPHPDWLIQTEIVRFEEGTYQGNKFVVFAGSQQQVPDVKGGLAVVQARVLVRNADGSEGPIIAEGSAMERSEIFHDFVEKAETAAIGRALAVAGYGTEAALDEADNLADAPVRPRSNVGTIPATALPQQPPAVITIEASNLPQPQQGGRQQKATQPQLQKIRDRSRELMLSPSGLQRIIREVVPSGAGPEKFFLDDVGDDNDGANDVLGFLANLSFADCGKVVQALDERGA